jgi:transposase
MPRWTSAPARSSAACTPAIALSRFKRFLQTLDREVPRDLDVHVILDNSSTHKTPAIRKWLTAHPRFVLHFTPTSSSWLNLVERWFAELTTKKLRRGAHRSVADLNRDIRAWMKTWNDDPKPYVWTTTADQILESITRYCTRINESGHSRLNPCAPSPEVVPGRDLI